MSIFSKRLKLVMDERGLTQARLCALTDIPKSAMNQYLNDRFKPKRDRTYILCRALDVNPAWLMGLTDNRGGFQESGTAMELSEEEQRLIIAYRAYPEIHEKLWEDIVSVKHHQNVFRAAKSKDGTVAPSLECMKTERIETLLTAPETDEDI